MQSVRTVGDSVVTAHGKQEPVRGGGVGIIVGYAGSGGAACMYRAVFGRDRCLIALLGLGARSIGHITQREAIKAALAIIGGDFDTFT